MWCCLWTGWCDVHKLVVSRPVCPKDGRTTCIWIVLLTQCTLLILYWSSIDWDKQAPCCNNLHSSCSAFLCIHLPPPGISTDGRTDSTWEMLAPPWVHQPGLINLNCSIYGILPTCWWTELMFCWHTHTHTLLSTPLVCLLCSLSVSLIKQSQLWFIVTSWYY